MSLASSLPASSSGRNRRAVALMLVSTAGYSVVPLVVALAGGGDAPFLLNAGLTLGLCLGYLPYLAVACRPLLRSRVVAAAVARRVFCWPILFMVVNNFEFAFFAWSTRFIDVAIAAILFETWPVLLIALTLWLYRAERRYRSFTVSLWLLLAVAFAGFAFVVLSQSGTAFGVGTGRLAPLAAGILLAVLASVVTSLSAFGFKWSTGLAAALGRGPDPVRHPGLELFGTVVASLIANVVVVPVNFAAGLAVGESLAPATFAAVVLAGVVCHAGAPLCWRNATLLTDNVGVNAIAYATPALSLFWLFLFSQAAVARVDFLVIGVMGVVSANLLINFEAEMQMGFKALLVALWGSGTFVYVRDELLVRLPVATWLWPGEPCLGALALSATVFTLVLAFRITRLAARVQREDDLMFRLYQTVDLLAARGVVVPDARRRISELDGAHGGAELKRAYEAARACLLPPRDALAREDQVALAAALEQLNSVAHSHRHGIEVGELFALVVFSGITVLLGLLGRPWDLAGWSAFLFELFAAWFCAVVVFLMVSVVDLHRDRSTALLEPCGPAGHALALRDARSRRFEQLVSVVVGLALAAGYAVLLWHKWIGR